MSNRVLHFEIQVDDIQRAIAFYTTVFGWVIEEWKGLGYDYYMVMTAAQGSTEPGISGGLLKRHGPALEEGKGVNAFVCTVVVDDFDAMAEKILESGGKVNVPKFEIAGMAHQGYFLDTENNIFGIHQPLAPHGATA